MARDEGIAVEQVVVDDDVAVDGSLYTVGRRGVAGTVFVHKIAGACAANCTHCGKCTEVLNLVLKRDPGLPDVTGYSVAPPKPIVMPG